MTTQQKLHLSKLAAEKAQKIIEEEGVPGKTYLRINIKGGGCAGYTFDLQLDDSEPGDMDEIFESYGVKLVSNSMCMTYIEGTVIDYVKGIYSSGFKFNNPLAKTTCGCNSSFSV